MGVIDVREGDGTMEVVETSGWAGRVMLDAEHPDGPRIVVSTDTPFRSLVVQSNRESDTDPTDSPLTPTWLLLAPAALATVYTILGLAVGISLFDPGRSHLDPFVSYGLLIPLFAVAVAGTRQLLVEADRVRMTNDSWNPNPWIYIVPGSFVLAFGGTFRLGPTTVTPSLAAALVGVLVVAVLASSIVAGPVYVAHRWQVLGDRQASLDWLD